MDQRTLLEKLLQVTGKQQRFFEQFITADDIQQAATALLKAQNFIVEAWQEKSRIYDIQQQYLVVPNAKVNKPYHFVFDVTGVSGIVQYKWVIPEETGIIYDETTNTFSGTPLVQGEFTLTLQFNVMADKAFSEKKVPLVINPDPKSLWKQLPSNTQDAFWKPDQAAALVPFGNRHLLMASKRGRSHAHEGSFRDDDFAAAFNEKTGWGVIAVADGAGSAKYSRRGAKLACDTVIESFSSSDLTVLDATVTAYLQSQDKEKLSAQFIEQLGKIAFAAQQRIKQEGGEIRDYATTLLFTLVKQYPEGYVISSFWVGDGAIGIYDDKTATATVLGTPDSGEFAGQTRFLTMPEIFTDNAYINRIRFTRVTDFTALMLMTDGITDPKFQTDANLKNGERWKELWQELNEEIDFSNPGEKTKEQILTWLDFWSPGNHDDRTIAILF